MNEQSTVKSRRAVFVLLVAAFLSGNGAAQPPTISVVPRNEGPVGISDLQVLLDVDMQFQIFDFEAQDKFCLVLGYVHEIDGQQPNRSPRNGVVCDVAGPKRLIVVMRPVGDKRRLMFALNDRNTGAGSTRTASDLPIGKVDGSSTFRVEETIGSDRETMLLHWRFGLNPPHPGPRHDVRILVRLDDNDFGIGTYSKPNDFGQ